MVAKMNKALEHPFHQSMLRFIKDKPFKSTNTGRVSFQVSHLTDKAYHNSCKPPHHILTATSTPTPNHSRPKMACATGQSHSNRNPN